MKRLAFRYSAFTVLLLATVAQAESGKSQPILDKWWPMCVFDGTGGNNNPQIKEMVRMAAVECKVHLDIVAYPIPPGADGGNAEAFTKAAKEKCNLTYGYRMWGVNRGSILAILGNSGTARQLCSAQGARDREFCGELGFDPGEAIKLKMANTGYFGGVAKPNEPAVSIVAGGAINARDMSAVALGQGMMSLPQGFGAGNGVGTEYEGQAAGGRGADSGWNDYGCRKMREAAFPNPRKDMVFNPKVDNWLPTKGKLVYLDVNDKERPIFGKPGGKAPNGAMAQRAYEKVPPPGPVVRAQTATRTETIPASESVFRGSTTDGARASQDSAAPSGHPDRGGAQVTSLRQSAEDTKDTVQTERSIPAAGAQRSGGRIVADENAKVDDAYLKELGADQPAGSYSGGESSLAIIAAKAEADYSATKGSASNSAAASASASAFERGASSGVGSAATGAPTSVGSAISAASNGNISPASPTPSTSASPGASGLAGSAGLSGSLASAVSSTTMGGDNTRLPESTPSTNGTGSGAATLSRPGEFWGSNRKPASAYDEPDAPRKKRRERGSEIGSETEPERRSGSGRRERVTDAYGTSGSSASQSGGITRVRR
jgi:hypothetical protein